VVLEEAPRNHVQIRRPTLKIVEKSRERLALRITRYGLSAGVCVLDRAHNTTTVVRLAVLIPYHRERVPLSQICDVTVRRSGRRGGYRTALRTRGGRDIALGEFAKEDALDAAKAIRDFLQSNGANKPASIPIDKNASR